MHQLSRSERGVLALVAVAALVGGLAPMVDAKSLATAIAYDGAALASAGLALVGALRMPQGRRDEWLFIAAGCFCFFAGDVVWDFYERVLHRPAPLPSLADLIYLAAYPLMVLGVMRLVRRRTDVDLYNAALDVGVVAMAVGLLVWEPLVVGSGRSLLGALIAGAYPVFDVILLAVIAALAGNRRSTLVNLFIVGGAGTLFIADLTYLVLESRGTYATGGFPDPLFVIGPFLLATAVWFDRPSDPDALGERRRTRPVATTAIIVAALTALPIDFGLIPETVQSQEAKTVRMLLRILLLAFVALRFARQAERNARLVEDLDRTSTRLTTVIENTADAVVFVGPDAEILEWNATAETLFGMAREEVIGTNALALFRDQSDADVAKTALTSLAHGGSVAFTLKLNPQGRPMVVAFQASAVLGAKNAVIGFVVVARDETRRVLSSHATQSFAQLTPIDALTQFARDLRAYVPFASLSLASVNDDRITELARIDTVDSGEDQHLEPAPEYSLISGPLLDDINNQRHKPFVALRAGDHGPFQDRVEAAHIAESILLPLLDRVTGDLRGLIGLGFEEPQPDPSVFVDSLSVVAPELAHSVANMTLYARERETAERLQELDDLREGFFGLVAHEVRSPLGAISTAAAVLRDHGVAMNPDEARELAAGISDSARRLARLTSDLVDASRGGRGTFPCELAPIDDLGGLVTAAVAMAAGDALTRVQVCVESSVGVVGDPDRLAQVVTNLVTNALKFSPDRVEVHLGRSGDTAELRVVDHGAGVPASHAHRLFERYTRLPYNGDGPRPSGSGLGLFITRELAVAHGGDLHFEPTIGGGATFVFRLPLATTGADA